MMNTKEITIAKLINLKNALADCGIEAELLTYDTSDVTPDNPTTFIALRADLWNCVDSSEVFMEVYAESDDGYEEIQHYVQPEGLMKALEEKHKM